MHLRKWRTSGRKFVLPCVIAVLAASHCVVGMGQEQAERNITMQKEQVQLSLGDETLTIRPLSESAVRIRCIRGSGKPAISPILTEKVPAPKFEVTEDGHEVVVSTSKMKVMADRTTGVLRFADAAGQVFLAEKPGGRRVLPTTVHNQPTFAAEMAFVSPPEERLYGSGQFQDGYLNIRDLPRRLTQVNTQIAVPFLLSSKGYGLLWHNCGMTELNPADRQVKLTAGGEGGPAEQVDVTTTEGTKKETRKPGDFFGQFSVDRAGRFAMLLDVGQRMGRKHHVEIDGKTVVDFNNFWLPPTTSWHVDLSAGVHRVKVTGEESDHPVIHFRPSEDQTVLRSPVGEGVDFVVFAGPDADAIIAGYRQLTGPAPMMPIWALGYIHCRERFSSQRQLLDTTAEFRRRKLPVDLVVQDWQYWGKYGWNAMRFDEGNYPDPAAMMRQLHEMNARLMLSVWSKVDRNSQLGKEFDQRGYYIPGTDWVDFFNPAARAFYWQNMSGGLLSLGIDAWWQDATEPENDDLVDRQTSAGPGEMVRNMYPLLVTQTVYEGQRKDAPQSRVCILTRSAFPGEQRYAAATWSGDIGNDWETLRRQIPAGLNFVSTGIPYWTTDAGGFFRPWGDQYGNVDYHERLLRWFQYATFCPLQRVHGFGTDTEFWRYGPKVEAEAKRYLELRYRLLPYIYTQASRITLEGSTLMRPLVMDFRGDAEALDQAHEFMFGPSLLVAPVLEKGATHWPVYLPQSPAGWVDFWSGQHHAGGQTVSSASPLEQIPLYVRAGSILPLGPVRQNTRDGKADPIEVRIYPGADCSYSLYEDNGVDYGYEKGQYSEIPFTWSDRERKLTIGQRRGAYPGMLPVRTFRVVLVGPDRGTGIDAASRANAEVRYEGNAVSVDVSR